MTAALLAGCGDTLSGFKMTGQSPQRNFQGFVGADEPRAVVIARDVLNQGGSAADAATALALTLTVTLPSRASLGSGGACLVRGGRPPEPDKGIFFEAMRPKIVPPMTYAVNFMPVATAPGKPAAPMLVRGLTAIQARYGTQRWEQLVAKAEALARNGAPVSRAFARDIAASGIPVTGTDNRPLNEGDNFVQPELAASLASLRSRGSTDLYTGQLAAAYAAGIDVDPAVLRPVVVSLEPATGESAGHDKIYFSPTAGGSATAAIWRTARADRRATRSDAAERAAAFDAAVAKSGVTHASDSDTGSTSFIVVDGSGATVACTLTMGHLFGARQVAGTTGILAAAPAEETQAASAAMTALVIANENTGHLIAAMADAGDPTILAHMALETNAAERSLNQVEALRVASSDATTRINAALCPNGLPRDPESCTISSDPRGNGMTAFAGPGGIR
jgi:gamma-glutamyltranspeptidase/glutathione hydrolase